MTRYDLWPVCRDRVTIEMSSYDLQKGRLIFRHKIRGWVDSRFLVIPIEAECPDPYDPAWKEGKP
jgi:hypothetical protein